MQLLIQLGDLFMGASGNKVDDIKQQTHAEDLESIYSFPRINTWK